VQNFEYRDPPSRAPRQPHGNGPARAQKGREVRRGRDTDSPAISLNSLRPFGIQSELVTRSCLPLVVTPNRRLSESVAPGQDQTLHDSSSRRLSLLACARRFRDGGRGTPKASSILADDALAPIAGFNYPPPLLVFLQYVSTAHCPRLSSWTFKLDFQTAVPRNTEQRSNTRPSRSILEAEGQLKAKFLTVGPAVLHNLSSPPTPHPIHQLFYTHRAT
jgi:hypothetical protein